MRKNSRNAAGSGTIRQRPDGRWEARITLERDPGTGKQRQKSFYGATQAEVRKKLQQAAVDIESGEYQEPSKLTVSAWLDIWLAEYTGNIKDTTRRSYSDNIKLHIKPHIGAVPLQKLRADTIQELYNSLEKSGNKGAKKDAPAGLSAKSVRNIHVVLHKALKQAIKLSYIKVNPTEACTLPRVEKKEMKIMQETEIPTFLKAVEGHRHGALYLVTLLSGMRRGEILGLTWSCVNFKNGEILVNKQLQRERVKDGKIRFVSLKNDKQRSLTPAETVFNILKEHKRRQDEKREKVGSLWTETDLVFTNETGGMLDADAVYKAYKKLLSDNGLSDIRIHDLRHTAATLMLQSGDDILTVKEALGHHSAAFTLDVYGHVTKKMKNDSANRMEAYIKGIQAS
jgi:integrase